MNYFLIYIQKPCNEHMLIIVYTAKSYPHLILCLNFRNFVAIQSTMEQ